LTLSTWALFMATETVLCLTPGPAVLFVVSQRLRYGGRRAVWANLGILSANAFYFLLSAIGLGAALATSHTLFLAIRYAGAAYLVYLGVATILGKGMALAPSGAEEVETGGGRLLARGFALQAANPKALLFFTALLPQFVRMDRPVAPQIAILGASSVVAEFLVLAAYGFFAGRLSTLARWPRFVTASDCVAGALLVGAGAGLALAGEKS
jgi:threonine/homoserine/homoserine lactone efflux protein